MNKYVLHSKTRYGFSLNYPRKNACPTWTTRNLSTAGGRFSGSAGTRNWELMSRWDCTFIYSDSLFIYSVSSKHLLYRSSAKVLPRLYGRKTPTWTCSFRFELWTNRIGICKKIEMVTHSFFLVSDNRCVYVYLKSKVTWKELSEVLKAL